LTEEAFMKECVTAMLEVLFISCKRQPLCNCIAEWCHKRKNLGARNKCQARFYPPRLDELDWWALPCAWRYNVC